MSYNEFVPIMNNYLSKIDTPSILEIGIEHGTITFQILNNLIRQSNNFVYRGVDIDIKNDILVFAENNRSDDYLIDFKEKNSLDELPKLVNANCKFDLTLIDGDHNYYTVSRELDYVKKLMHDESILIVDDYHGPWALRDYWYGDDGDSPQVNNILATKEDSVIKKRWWRSGLLTAVNDFIYDNSDMDLYSLSDGALYKHNENLKLDVHRSYCHAVFIVKKGFNDELLAKI